RLAARDQLLAVRRVDDELDELVDGLVLDADRVAVAGGVGRFRRPEAPLLVPRRLRLAEAVRVHVEVVVLDALLILHGIDKAQLRADADALQVRDVGQVDALEGRRARDDLEAELLAVLAGELAALEVEAGLLE